MVIFSLHTGHDASLALYEDYELKFIRKEERLSRIKCHGELIPELCLKELRRYHDLRDADVAVLSRAVFPRKYFRHEPLNKKVERSMSEFFKRKVKYLNLCNELRRLQAKEEAVLDLPRLAAGLGLRENCEIMFSNHHYAHALPALFYKPEWNDALIYTADGGGDFIQYSIYYFDGKQLHCVYGGDRHIWEGRPDEKVHSLGQMYAIVTEIAGFLRNRHEGKITGLAAFGQPVFLEQMKAHYHVQDDGLVRSDFGSYAEMEAFYHGLAKGADIKDVACSAQKLLEVVMVESFRKLQKRFRFSNVGLSGGVFSNVRLNQMIAELDGVKDVFIVPPMGDEGLVMGMPLDVMIRKRGFDDFLRNRRPLGTLYYGEEFPGLRPYLDSRFSVVATDDIIEKTVELLRADKVVGLFTKGMEYGPRALGARSILITPRDASINHTVNLRLNRSEFMPFAPYVRAERADDVFVIPPSSRAAMSYMTITCDVRPEWRDKIPAVVHVDGTARPQIIHRAENPFYYDILHRFEQATGLPCLVNTSFNAHEEPIINRPQEALQALYENRIDYLVADDVIVARR